MTMPADPVAARPTIDRAALSGSTPRPTPGVRFALDRQADELARLEQTVEVLEDRLGAVLRPRPPAPAVAGAPGPLPAEPDPPCVVAVELHGRTERIEAMVERLQRITDWVDV